MESGDKRPPSSHILVQVTESLPAISNYFLFALGILSSSPFDLSSLNEFFA